MRNSVNNQDNADKTPLYWACYYGYNDVVKILMSAGADETITNNGRQTAVPVAERKGHKRLARTAKQDKFNEDVYHQGVERIQKRCARSAGLCGS